MVKSIGEIFFRILIIIAAIQLRKEISNEWMLIISGIISVLFGDVLIFNPAAGGLAVILVIGAFALVYGMMMIIFEFRLRSLPGRLEKSA